MVRLYVTAVLSTLIAITLAGCTGSTVDYPATVPVSGSISYNGGPAAFATITFSPETDGGYAGSAVTDAQGKYALTTFQSEDGAVPGKYRVMVHKKSQRKQGQVVGTEEDPGPVYISEEMDGTDVIGGDASADTFEAQDLLPVVYSHRDSTTLTAEVTPNDGTFDFTLTD